MGGYHFKDTLLPSSVSVWRGADDWVRWGVREVRLGVGRGIIKVTEPELGDLCIYSSARKLRIKRSGNFPGHWPNPHGEEARGWRGQERRGERERERESTASMANRWRWYWQFDTHWCIQTSPVCVFVSVHMLVCMCEREKEYICSLCVCVCVSLSAHRLWLMSLKGQTPLRKINGVS